MVDTWLVCSLLVLTWIAAPAGAVYRQPTLGKSPRKFYRHGAVSSDSAICSQVAANVLRENGSVVDAGVAAMFCNGVLDQPHMGLGGGSVMTIYESPRNGGPKEMISINGDIRCPKWIEGPASIDWKLSNKIPQTYETVAVPGEVAGYWWAWNRYGRLPWRRLVEPSIRLARDGFRASRFFAQVMKTDWEKVEESPGLEFFKRFHANGTSRPIQEGEFIRDEKLAETLETIAGEGAETFYRGRLSELILEDLKEYGVKITKEDLSSYDVRVIDTVTTSIGEGDRYTVHSPSFPAYGPVNHFVLRIMHAYNMTSSQLSTPKGMALYYHRFAEVLKFLYGINRCFGEDINLVPECQGVLDQLLNGTDFLHTVMNAIDDQRVSTTEHYETLLGNSQTDEPEDRGTSHLSVVSRDGSALAATSTVASVFGSGIKGRRTGIVFNDRLFSFTSDPDHRNAKDVRPGSTGYTKRVPTIVTDKDGRVILSVGTSGGSRITGGLLKVILMHLEYGLTLQDAIDYPILAEGGKVWSFLFLRDPFDQKILDELKRKGQEFQRYDEYIYPKLYTAVTQGVSVLDCYRDGKPVPLEAACMEAVSDFRKGGKPNGY